MYTLKTKIEKELLKNSVFYYTFCSLLLKCIIFLGLSLNKIHLRPMLFTAVKMVFAENIFRPVFYTCFILAFLSLSYLFKNRSRLWYLLIFNLIISILMLVDLWYIRGFNTMPSLSLFQQGTNLGNMSDSILSVIHLIDAVFIFDIPVLIIYTVLKKNLYKGLPRDILSFGTLFIVSMVLLLTILPIKNSILHIKVDEEVVSAFDSNVTCNNLSPIGYHILNAYSFWKDTHLLVLSAQEKSEISTWFKANRENLPDNKYKSMFKGKNLILIQVESLEKFVINQKVDGKELTPNLNRLLKNSLYFSNFYEQVNNGMSSDADLLINTSVYPIRSGSTFFRYPFTSYNSLPLLLKAEGYTSYDYYPVKGSFWNWMPSVRSIGFENCIDSSSYNLDDSFGFGISDGSLFKQVEPMVVKQKRPFFTSIITLSSHMPFIIPPKYRGLSLSEEHENNKLGGYFESVHYVDKQIGIFLEDLKNDGLLDNSLIAIYGDHEGIHRFYPNDIPLYTPSEDWWKDNEKHIPLILYNPSLKGEEIKTAGGQIDVLPTLTYLMGIDEEKIADSAMGRNLLKTSKSFSAMADGSFIGGSSSLNEKEHAVKGLDIADIIIRSNYFKDR